jgi:hypothetical protein
MAEFRDSTFKIFPGGMNLECHPPMEGAKCAPPPLLEPLRRLWLAGNENYLDFKLLFCDENSGSEYHVIVYVYYSCFKIKLK